jgi:hypothetical protein
MVLPAVRDCNSERLRSSYSPMKRRSLLAITAGSLVLTVCPAADPSDPIVGKWRPPQKPKPKSQRVVVFRANGTCYYYYPNVSSVGGKWTVSSKDDRKYEVVWAGGAKEEEFRLGSDDKLRNKGGEIIAERFTG